jgi:hypothetical protein
MELLLVSYSSSLGFPKGWIEVSGKEQGIHRADAPTIAGDAYDPKVRAVVLSEKSRIRAMC